MSIRDITNQSKLFATPSMMTRDDLSGKIEAYVCPRTVP
jgi:hypothetical protein